ncbi:MAG: response regulator [Acidobacteria bacterium]|nr:response regulator [Acidobacteriota bacterium]
MNKRKITVLLADDHALVRQGFRRILEGEPDIEVAGEASNGGDAVTQATKLRPEVVVMDVTMPSLNGIEATRRILKSMQHTQVLALSMHKDQVYVREMLKAGAKGYLLKDSADADLISAIRAVARGDGYLSPAVSGMVLNDYSRHVRDPIDLLSSREREILQLLAEGQTNKMIASQLNISVYTVDDHRGRIMAKLNLHSIGELVRFAMRKGIVD